ncbi:hypothetical protein H8S95_13460 [Pontibacter sp. KCTC 32443]|uniref:hypothetical protein n=1 Tax=Pontibacter TaxID=323449 RepID=UPI00164CFD8E|nr:MULTISPECIES: hypothetical protein [Pontibacter]MBC5775079.1 hypothetical protein [Pontibacter sp. KCTC 32443]
MKHSLLILSIFLFSFTFVSDNTIDRLSVKGPLKFNKSKFELAWTDKPNDIYYIQEYLPKGEKLENFNQMLTIHLFATDLEAEQAVAQKVKELAKRKQTDELCNYQVNESANGKEFIVDFILSEKKNDKIAIAEFNVYRYKQIEVGAGQKAILVYAYSKRSYGDAIIPFLKNLKTDRTDYLKEMIAAELPVIAIGKN